MAEENDWGERKKKRPDQKIYRPGDLHGKSELRPAKMEMDETKQSPPNVEPDWKPPSGRIQQNDDKRKSQEQDNNNRRDTHNSNQARRDENVPKKKNKNRNRKKSSVEGSERGNSSNFTNIRSRNLSNRSSAPPDDSRSEAGDYRDREGWGDYGWDGQKETHRGSEPPADNQRRRSGSGPSFGGSRQKRSAQSNQGQWQRGSKPPPPVHGQTRSKPPAATRGQRDSTRPFNEDQGQTSGSKPISEARGPRWAKESNDVREQTGSRLYQVQRQTGSGASTEVQEQTCPVPSNEGQGQSGSKPSNEHGAQKSPGAQKSHQGQRGPRIITKTRPSNRGYERPFNENGRNVNENKQSRVSDNRKKGREKGQTKEPQNQNFFNEGRQRQDSERSFVEFNKPPRLQQQAERQSGGADYGSNARQWRGGDGQGRSENNKRGGYSDRRPQFSDRRKIEENGEREAILNDSSENSILPADWSNSAVLEVRSSAGTAAETDWRQYVTNGPTTSVAQADGEQLSFESIISGESKIDKVDWSIEVEEETRRQQQDSVHNDNVSVVSSNESSGRRGRGLLHNITQFPSVPTIPHSTPSIRHSALSSRARGSRGAVTRGIVVTSGRRSPRADEFYSDNMVSDGHNSSTSYYDDVSTTHYEEQPTFSSSETGFPSYRGNTQRSSRGFLRNRGNSTRQRDNEPSQYSNYNSQPLVETVQNAAPTPPSPPSNFSFEQWLSRDQGPRIQHQGKQLAVFVDYFLQHPGAGGEAEKNSNNLIDMSKKLAHLYLPLLIADLEFTYKNNLEQHMWKQCFYEPIEALRNIITRSATPNLRHPCSTGLLNLVSEAIGFYKELLENLQTKYHFDLNSHLCCSGNRLSPMDIPDLAITAPTVKPADHQTKVALGCCQRFMVALGDLERYKSCHVLKDFGLARIWYLKALLLQPGNGRVYNQLALLAFYTKRNLDAVYYYLRALAAKHKFQTAEQSVKTIFNEIHKKVTEYEHELLKELESIDKKLSDAPGTRRRRRPVAMTNEDLLETSSKRQEIWVGGKSDKSCDDQVKSSSRDLDLLLQAATNDLHKRTLTYLLDCAGMLITKIGMEHFDSIAEKGFVQLRELMSREESPLTALQLMQLAIVCFFCVHHASQKVTEAGTCSVVHSQAVQLVFSFWGLLLEVLNKYQGDLESVIVGQSTPPPQLMRVLPTVRIMATWLSNMDVYALYKDLSLDGLECERFKMNVWANLVAICNKLTELVKKEILLEPSKKYKGYSDAFYMPEDICISSFFSAFDNKNQDIYLPSMFEEQKTCCVHARLSSLLMVCEFWDGMDLSYFSFEDGVFVAHTQTSPSNPPSPQLTRRTVASDDEEEETVPDEITPEELEKMSSEMRQLHLQKMEQKNKDQAFSNEANGKNIVLEIFPTYLVPDTNVFIDHLALIKRILSDPGLNLRVPVIVMQELRGLSTNRENEWLAARAKEAIVFLEKESEESKNSKLQSVTSKGNCHRSLKMAAEADDDSLSKERSKNDDKILDCCMTFCDDTVKHGIQDLKNEPLKLVRKVVLLTDDRALRIKALSKNVPSRSIESFVDWKGI